eukprot:TRINITY_DN23179_c0_g1_i1.p1 TRINITY_DN23179_c0_g1~~TRINITY_DN23179_c0_g1_i1.p1  ORF type:complete len:163 (-),score=31.69 TRINITY_DN23179_c0_g1_i1:23-511(-)
MSTSAVPEGLHTVTPYLSIHNANDAIEWYKKAFDAKVIQKIEIEHESRRGHIGHSELQIGNSRLMIADDYCLTKELKSPNGMGDTTVCLAIYVEDCEKWWERALENGAKELKPLSEKFWGDKMGILSDPFGHSWSIASHVKDVSEKEMREAIKKMYEQKSQT